MNSEFKFHSTTMAALHEQRSNFDNLITARRALQTTTTTMTTHQHSAHTTMTKFDSLTVDNQNNQMTANNQSQKHHLKQRRDVVDAHLTSRHESPSLSSSPPASVVSTASPTSCEDRINNNNNNNSIERCDYPRRFSRTTPDTSNTVNGGVSVMSLKKNFSLNLQQHQTTTTTNGSQPATPASDASLTSPTEAPFSRRYAEISQFKNHPNVEW